MRPLLLLAAWATTALAQAPSAALRRAEARRAEAQRAVALALRANDHLQTLPPRAGTVAVLSGTVRGAGMRGLGGGLADLLTTDLARVHALRLVERMQAQAIADELGRDGLDASARPATWRLLGAADIVVLDALAESGQLQIVARVVNLERQRTSVTVTESGPIADLFATERRVALGVVRSLGVQVTASERRAIADRPSGSIEAFTAWAAAMDAVESGDAPQAERLLRQALEIDPGINAVFDAGLLASAGLGAPTGSIIPMPGSSAAGEDPTGEGLATEGNESEYGEAWFEGVGERKLTLYELAIPLSASLPLGRARFDVSSIWSSNRVDTPANDVFHAWGFTDLHVRYTRPLGGRGFALTFGGALPTRNVHGVDDDIRRVPLPPDLVPSAMYRRRNASSTSGGFFYTGTSGRWNWGAATGAEWTAHYDELSPSLHTVAVAPGLRWRLRADAARSVGPGHLTIGSSVMTVAPATRDGASLAGGTRTLARGSYLTAWRGVDLELGGWLLRSTPVTSAGVQLRAGSSVSALFVNSRLSVGRTTLSPGVDVKQWRTAGATASTLIVPQIVFSRPLSRTVQGEVGVDVIRGHFHEQPGATDIPVQGVMMRFGVRVEP